LVESRHCSAGAVTEMLSPVKVSSLLYSELSSSVLSPSLFIISFVSLLKSCEDNNNNNNNNYYYY